MTIKKMVLIRKIMSRNLETKMTTKFKNKIPNIHKTLHKDLSGNRVRKNQTHQRNLIWLIN